MRVTLRGKLVAAFLSGVAVTSFVAWMPGDPPLPNVTSTSSVSPDGYDVQIEEDGSGVQYAGSQEVRTFPAGTFVWDCHRMGNRICG